ncbi:MAG TPA: DNA recombination protein RmuC [Vicinamibacterales bacterium]|nr:DNA recombination protein RmuC [Vicinamibacterales bacterium]
MTIELSILTVALVGAVALLLGALLGWLSSQSARTRLQIAIERDRAAHAERLKACEAADANLRQAFESIGAEVLRSNSRAFLDLAETRLRAAQTQGTADIDARKKAVEDLLTPLHRTLDQVDRELKDAERRRVESGAQLMQRIAALDVTGQNLRTETSRLVDALKRPGVRGRWGELQLKRVVELAGMLDRCDFEEQQTFTAEERRMRPDVIVRLPGGKNVVVDAKVPLDAYLKALEASDESCRQRLLMDHARQVRTHLTQLAAKGYAAHIHPSPDFVVMFLPGEMFFSAALEQDPTLIEFGVEQRVIPASPTTLIALLRAVAYGWQQEAMEENARQISDLGRSLYDSLRVLGGHFDTLGSRLKAGLDAYNQAVGSLEGNVLVKARRFKELQVTPDADDIKTLEPIDRVPRMLQARELTDGLPFADVLTTTLDDDDVVSAKTS